MNKVPVGFNGLFTQKGMAPETGEDWSQTVKSPKQLSMAAQECQLYDGPNIPFYNAHSQLKGSMLPCRQYESPLYEPNQSPCNSWYNPNQCAFGCGAPTDPAAAMTTCGASKSTKKPTQQGGGPNGSIITDTSSGAPYTPFGEGRITCCNRPDRPYTDAESNIWYRQVCPPMNSGDCAGSGTIYGCGCGPLSYRQMLKGTPTY